MAALVAPSDRQHDKITHKVMIKLNQYYILCFDAALVFVTPTASRANIAVALAPFLVAHRCRLAITPSLGVELHSRRPSPSIAVHHRPSPRRPSPPSRHRAILIRPSPLRSQSIAVALVLSLTVHRHQRAVGPSIAVKEPSRRPLPSRRPVHHR